MEDSFNPYTQWLGIAGARRRPNHYALLGLKLFESDVATIKAAAERRIAAVRATDPASREALRQRVLEELAAARLWLSDPDKKRRYDESLREQAQARSIHRPADTTGASRPTVATARPGVNLLPPTASLGANRGLSPRGAAGIDALLPPTALDSDPMAPVVTGAAGTENPYVATTEDDDLESQLPPPAYAIPAPHLPPHAAPPMSPVSAPTAVASIDQQSVSGAGPSPRDDGRSAEVSPQLATARKAAQRLAVHRQRTQQWTIAALLILIVSVAAGLWIAYANGLIRIGGPSSEVATSDSQENDASREITSDNSKDANQGRTATAGDANNNGSKRDLSNEGTEDRAGDNSRLAPQNPPVTNAKASTSDSDSSTVRPATDQKMTPEEPPPDPAQVAKFQSMLVSAREALGERKPDVAKQRLAEAGELAASKEQKRLVASFDALQTHVAAFWEAVGEGMKGLEEAGELQVGSTLVSIVEASKDTLVIRVNGQNRRYKADQLPAGVAVAIAKKWFDDRPDNKVILGSFYFVNPRSDVADAKRLWEEAAGGGVDVKDMLALLPLAIESSDAKKP